MMTKAMHIFLDDVLEPMYGVTTNDDVTFIRVTNHYEFMTLFKQAIQSGTPLGVLDFDHNLKDSINYSGPYIDGTETAKMAIDCIMREIRNSDIASIRLRLADNFKICSHSGYSDKRQEVFLLWQNLQKVLKNVYGARLAAITVKCDG